MTIREHVKNTHLAEKPSICTHCGETFVDKKKLQKHLDSLSANVDKPHVCDWPSCTEAFVSETELEAHTKSHAKVRIAECKSFQS